MYQQPDDVEKLNLEARFDKLFRELKAPIKHNRDRSFRIGIGTLNCCFIPDFYHKELPVVYEVWSKPLESNWTVRAKELFYFANNTLCINLFEEDLNDIISLIVKVKPIHYGNIGHLEGLFEKTDEIVEKSEEQVEREEVFVDYLGVRHSLVDDVFDDKIKDLTFVLKDSAGIILVETVFRNHHLNWSENDKDEHWKNRLNAWTKQQWIKLVPSSSPDSQDVVFLL